MIRINLIGRGPARRGKKGGVGLRLPDIPNVGILLFVLLLVIEGAVFYLWQTSASDEATRANARLQLRKRELVELEKNKSAIAAATEEIKKLAEQKLVFDELFAEKIGPVGALQYLSFILQPRDEATTPTEDLKALEAAGWRVAWDARRAWVTSYRELQGEVTIQGRAMAHEDVAEVQRRLESSPYFRDPRLVYQENKKDDRLGLGFAEFSIRATLVYLIEPLKKGGEEAEEGATEGQAAQADAGSTDSADAATDGAALIAPKLVVDAGSGPTPTQVPAEPGADASEGLAPDAEADVAPDIAPDTAESDTAKSDTAESDTAQPDTAKPAPPKQEKPAEAPPAPPPPKDEPKAPMPGAAGAQEPPPAAGADAPPAATEP